MEFAVEDAGALPVPERGGLDGERKTLGAMQTGEAAGKRIAFAADESGAAGIGAVVTRQLCAGRKRGGFRHRRRRGCR